MPSAVFARLEEEVIAAGLCTHCGTCAGLSEGQVRLTAVTLLPTARTPNPQLLEIAYTACPGRGVDYPGLNRSLFGRLPENWLMGHYRQLFVGYATEPSVRQQAASGGVLTQTLLHLLANGRIQGAVACQMGQSTPWQAQPVIATTAAAIRAASQSIYAPVPVNTILPQMSAFNGRLAYVGLPDQVAALRRLQELGHEGANKVDFVLGPYVGTNLLPQALLSFLRSHGVNSLEEITRLRYRDGEWPGHLSIHLRDGRHLTAEKFHYNYLIPFYMTPSSGLTADFTNELTDISVGDAWSPAYESQKQGFSVVVARSAKGETLLQEMAEQGAIRLSPLPLAEALAMHGHMLDFKKRGTFIRLQMRRALGQRTPTFGYHPQSIPLSRYAVEGVISGLFWLCATRPLRRLVEWVPLGVIGPMFNRLRLGWKRLSKPVKRHGLTTLVFELDTTP